MTSVTALTLPSTTRYDAWRDAVVEFGGAHMDGSGFFGGDQPDLSREGFESMVARRRAQADPATSVPDGWVRCSYFWLSDGPDDAGEVLGFLALRHSLTDFLLQQGGHIGYSVRPSRRREGHASRALGRSLPHARALGLDRVLVTCDEDNVGSRRVIEAAGGGYEDSRAGKRRYWIST